jgi:drug/metabolite transporter (DMT)-like permease
MLLSAFFLALYDIAKKSSVRSNAVFPVLLISSFSGAVAYISSLALASGLSSVVNVAPFDLFLIGVKGLIVAISWVFTYYALRTLPVTIATPIRASAPALVFIVAFFVYDERPTLVHGAGMALVFLGYWAFGWAGKCEGIDFLRSKPVWFAVAGMVMSALSSLWDKFIFQKRAIPVETVQFWFQFFLVLLYTFFFIIWKKEHSLRKEFQWRWTIPLTGILLAAADWLYFHGLAIPDVSIAEGALLRRFSVVITFILGAVFFHERNLKRKAIALAAILAGVVLLCK